MGVTFHKAPIAAGGGKGVPVAAAPERETARVKGHFSFCSFPHGSPSMEYAELAKLVDSTEPVKLPYILLFELSLFDDARVVKCGMRPWVVKSLAADLKIETSRLIDHLAIPRSTYNRKFKDRSALNVTESERVLGVAKLVGQVQAMVEGNEDAAGFDAAAWVGNWLESPLPAIGNSKPIDLMDTSPGQELVSQLLQQMQSGAYA